MTKGGPNSGKTIGFRAMRPDGSTKRFGSRLEAENWAGAGEVRRITRNHNGTKVEHISVYLQQVGWTPGK